MTAVKNMSRVKNLDYCQKYVICTSERLTDLRFELSVPILFYLLCLLILSVQVVQSDWFSNFNISNPKELKFRHFVLHTPTFVILFFYRYHFKIEKNPKIAQNIFSAENVSFYILPTREQEKACERVWYYSLIGGLQKSITRAEICISIMYHITIQYLIYAYKYMGKARMMIFVEFVFFSFC